MSSSTKETTECNGDGICLRQCFCECIEDIECTSLCLDYEADESDHNHSIFPETCSCEHKEHVGEYCPSKCKYNCQPVKCHNYLFCKEVLPKWVLWCHNEMCTDCSINYGKIYFTDIIDECPVCFEMKEMIKPSCNKHNICADCWRQIADKADVDTGPLCPQCRGKIWWKK